MINAMFEVRPISEKTDRKLDPVNAHCGADSRDGQRWTLIAPTISLVQFG